ncbi:MAG: EamA family transporter RarD [Anaerolineales bacterium]|nr:EamA family transporter RarD [Anaerolineales bacterium]
MNQGILYALGAYGTWGLFPAYWKLLKHVPALQLLSHRIIWSFLFLLAFLLATKQWTKFRRAIVSLKVLSLYLVAAVLIGVNWLTYVWAVNAGYIVETSLGYFINPLLNVLLGVLFFRERLRPLQWLPVMLAAVGVIYLTWAYGRLPWIALLLAFSFGFYGLVKKIAPLSSVFGLSLETGLLFLPALGWLLVAERGGQGAFLHAGLATDLLLVGAGPITSIPLLMFAAAAQRIPLSMLGIIQYIAPTLQFLLGIFAFREPFTHAQLIGFSIVWTALLLFWGEGFWAQRRLKAQAPAD